ncbi:MAG: aldolase/citrate lyase family protein [Armatimonadota bacterium]|nr:aldolase/citrate lyase family protein [Armatimonadota bacterium]
MHIRPSRVLRKLRAGEVVSCFKLNLTCSRVADLASALGFDCIWVDMEHTSLDWSDVEKIILAAKTHDSDVIVRVARGSYSDYIRPLELDAAGIMVPHCMGLEDARFIVRTTRFQPLGRRPVDGGNSDGLYCNVPFVEYLEQANEQRFVAVQIEDPEPLDEIDDIASLPGIDILFFGPGDFSHAIGVPGEMNHPRVVEARRRVAEAALAHGKFAGTMAGPDNLEELVDMGYRFLNIGADVLGLNAYCTQLLEQFRSQCGKLERASSRNILDSSGSRL